MTPFFIINVSIQNSSQLLKHCKPACVLGVYFSDQRTDSGALFDLLVTDLPGLASSLTSMAVCGLFTPTAFSKAFCFCDRVLDLG